MPWSRPFFHCFSQDACSILTFKDMEMLGIDVGGSGIKGAVVNLQSGKFTTKRIRYPTPQPSTPRAVSEIIGRITRECSWKNAIGIGFPAVVKKNVIYSAANVDQSWIGLDAGEFLTEATGCPVALVNDADAAALAELNYSGLKHKSGTVLFLTVGTGIGSGLIRDGKLIPNTEFGHLILEKWGEAESYASDAARKRDRLRWKDWAPRFGLYLRHLEDLFQPDRFIIGGGASKKGDRFVPYLNINTRILMASLKNKAGIIGAALVAKQAFYG